MFKRYSLSIFSFSLSVVLYIWILNIFSNQSVMAMYLAIVPALLLLLLFIFLGYLHVHLLKAVSLLLVIIASITIFFKWRYQATVTEDIVLSGMLNDISLTFEMLSIPLFFWLLGTALLPILFLSQIKIKYSGLLRGASVFILTLTLAVTLAWIQGYKSRDKGQIRDYRQVQAIGSFSPVDILYAWKKARKAYQVLHDKYDKARSIKRQFVIRDEKEKDRLIVLVVGESSRGDHFGINGYDRNTTPGLEQLEHLYSFHNAKSCDTLTMRSMHYMFSPLECKEQNEIKSASFVQILHTFGYRVEMYSLQTLNAFYHYLGYDKLISKYAIVKEQSGGTKDISLLPYISKAIEAYQGGKELIVVHTLGSHQIYSDRVERASIKYVPACQSSDPVTCSKQELANSYDNTIAAIDTFLTHIITKLKGKNAMLVYLSDHGESLGEGGIYFHGKPKKIAPNEQFEIPFLFWFSDSYSKSLEGKRFRKWVDDFSLDANISHNYLFHSMLGCAGVSSTDGGINAALNFCQE